MIGSLGTPRTRLPAEYRDVVVRRETLDVALMKPIEPLDEPRPMSRAALHHPQQGIPAKGAKRVFSNGWSCGIDRRG